MPNTATESAHNFMAHRSALLDLLEHIPEQQAGFAAWEGAMSFKRLIDHLNGSSARMQSLMHGEKPEPMQPSVDFAEAKAVMRRGALEVQSMLSSLTEAQLSSVVPAFGGMQLAVYQLVNMLIEHEIHHKGQIWMMARMIGLEPPRFVKMG